MTRLLALACALLFALPVAAQSFTISNARVADGLGNEIPNATITVRNGRIMAVRADGAPGDIDAGGAWVTPGFVAAYGVLGISEVNAVGEADDRDAVRSPYSAALDARDAYNAASVALGVSRRDGITRMAVVPDTGRDIFGGQAITVSLGETDTMPIERGATYQVIAMGEYGSRLAGGSRTATYARLRDAFAEAAAYDRNRGAYQFGRTEDALLTRADADAIVDVIRGRTTALIFVQRASDIRRVIALRREYPQMRMAFAGAAEGWQVASEIAEAGIPVIVTPMQNLPVSFDALAATQSNAGRMIDAGVKVAVVDTGTSTATQRLNQQAAQLVAQSRVPGAGGATHGEALATITSVAADMIGLSDAGRIAKGARADIVIWDGDPLEATSAPTRVFIDGVEQSLVSRQTRLRDRYNPVAPETGLPPQYSRTGAGTR